MNNEADDAVNKKADAPAYATTTSHGGDGPTQTIQCALRQAIRDAEKIAEDLDGEIDSLESQRDQYARFIGNCQREIDRLSAERHSRKRHIRNLTSLDGTGGIPRGRE